jgi:hypothetical protein
MSKVESAIIDYKKVSEPLNHEEEKLYVIC